MMTKEEGKPDVLAFFNALGGVQAFDMEPGEKMPLMVFSAKDANSARLMQDYTLAYILESRYQENLKKIDMALMSYAFNQNSQKPNSGTAPGMGSSKMGYPDSLDV